MKGRTIRTVKKRDSFLAALFRTAGNVSKACAAINLSRTAAYDWKREDLEFSTLWDSTIEETTEALEQEIYRRAHDGCDKPVFYQGEECGAVREYSDVLAMFILKARRPEKYRERTEITGRDGGPIRILKAEDMTDDELARIAAAAK